MFKNTSDSSDFESVSQQHKWAEHKGIHSCVKKEEHSLSACFKIKLGSLKETCDKKCWEARALA